MCSKKEEIDNELLMKAIAQAIANVSLEEGYLTKEEEKETVKKKVLGGRSNNGRMGRLSYRGY